MQESFQKYSKTRGSQMDFRNKDRGRNKDALLRTQGQKSSKQNKPQSSKLVERPVSGTIPPCQLYIATVLDDFE